MTAQISDRFKYEGKDYSLVAITNPLKVHPSDFGIKPALMSTACWRGFYCTYSVKDNRLHLETMTVRTEDGKYPKINGVTAVPVSRELQFYEKMERPYTGPYQYENLSMLIDFSGKILLGSDFLHEYYIHMGFQRAWAYKILIELELENGTVKKMVDYSEHAQKVRQNKKGSQCSPVEETAEGILKFVEDCFSLDYAEKAWWI